jgi:hypothetical protein
VLAGVSDRAASGYDSTGRADRPGMRISWLHLA